MYHFIGVYNGSVTLSELVGRLASCDLARTTEPGDYSTTTDHHQGIPALFADIAWSIPGAWRAAMAVIIPPRGAIPLHADLPLGEGWTRYHLVLQTNVNAWSFHDNSWQQLALGGIYSVDPAQQHASMNWGETDRIHLVVDTQ